MNYEFWLHLVPKIAETTLNELRYQQNTSEQYPDHEALFERKG